MKTRVRAALVAVALIAASAGCSASSSDGAGQPDDAAVSESPTPLPTITEKPQEPSDSKGRASAEPVTTQEEKFVQAVGDEDVLDAAVLELGQEACDRADFVGQVDEAALADALKDAEIANAEIAIPYLCPTWVEQLAQSQGGAVDGTTDVGTDLAPGAYESVNPGKKCSWSVVAEDGTVLSEGRAADTVAQVGANAAELVSTNCTIWLPHDEE